MVDKFKKNVYIQDQEEKCEQVFDVELCVDDDTNLCLIFLCT